MKITLTTERGESVTLELLPGENAFLTADGAELPAGASLYLHPSGDSLGLGAVDEDNQWWDYASSLEVRPA